ncbi:hypothetical protein DUGA2_62770 [Duganella sp. HH101]|nr:hypothetical protein DUGA2_62770 [Duganella sp. HH101]
MDGAVGVRAGAVGHGLHAAGQVVADALGVFGQAAAQRHLRHAQQLVVGVVGVAGRPVGVLAVEALEYIAPAVQRQLRQRGTLAAAPDRRGKPQHRAADVAVFRLAVDDGLQHAAGFGQIAGLVGQRLHQAGEGAVDLGVELVARGQARQVAIGCAIGDRDDHVERGGAAANLAGLGDVGAQLGLGRRPPHRIVEHHGQEGAVVADVAIQPYRFRRQHQQILGHLWQRARRHQRGHGVDPELQAAGVGGAVEQGQVQTGELAHRLRQRQGIGLGDGGLVVAGRRGARRFLAELNHRAQIGRGAGVACRVERRLHGVGDALVELFRVRAAGQRGLFDPLRDQVGAADRVGAGELVAPVADRAAVVRRGVLQRQRVDLAHEVVVAQAGRVGRTGASGALQQGLGDARRRVAGVEAADPVTHFGQLRRTVHQRDVQLRDLAALARRRRGGAVGHIGGRSAGVRTGQRFQGRRVGGGHVVAWRDSVAVANQGQQWRQRRLLIVVGLVGGIVSRQRLHRLQCCRIGVGSAVERRLQCGGRGIGGVGEVIGRECGLLVRLRGFQRLLIGCELRGRIAIGLDGGGASGDQIERRAAVRHHPVGGGLVELGMSFGFVKQRPCDFRGRHRPLLDL